MALFLSQNDYTPSKLLQHVKHVSSLIRNDFEIDVMGNDNKTIADNAIEEGYRVQGYNGSTLANIVFNHPIDGDPLFIFRTASSAYQNPASPPLILLLAAIIIQSLL